MPLLAAPLIPYKTVGIFLCAIMALSGAVTLLALPSIIKIAEKVLCDESASVLGTWLGHTDGYEHHSHTGDGDYLRNHVTPAGLQNSRGERKEKLNLK